MNTPKSENKIRHISTCLRPWPFSFYIQPSILNLLFLVMTCTFYMWIQFVCTSNRLARVWQRFNRWSDCPRSFWYSPILSVDYRLRWGASSSARLRFPTELSAMTMYSPRAQKSCCRLRGRNTSPPPYSNPTITPLENPCNTQLLMSRWSDWKKWLWFRSHVFLYFGCDLCS